MTTFRSSYKKYNNKKTFYNDFKYDSKFEAGVAMELDIRLRAGEIKGWENQYKVECVPYDAHGKAVLKCKVSHKVDFRLHLLDDCYELLEAKGFETADYRMRRKWLLNFWLPEHSDHTYRVVNQASWRGTFFK